MDCECCSDIKIYDDFLTKEQYLPLYQYFIDTRTGFNGESVPWYWVDGVVTMDDGRIQFVSVGYAANNIVNRTMFHVLTPILEKLEVMCLYRIKANLGLPESLQSISHEDTLHTDDWRCDPPNTCSMTTGIYYVNSNNGYTLFEDGTKVESVANRMVTFPCTMRHGGIPHNDSNKGRIVVNFNWF
tara:strand:+ start:115 stop:669 length:555 start_codon:yes stop_codon:yes gene_type:complete